MIAKLFRWLGRMYGTMHGSFMCGLGHHEFTAPYYGEKCRRCGEKYQNDR